MSQSPNWFSSDYFTARDRFRQAVGKAGGRMDSLPLRATGPGNENLGIDVGWFGTDRPRRVLLHTSGLHGVEGFVGSAIQLQLIDDLPQLTADSALVIVHVLNPYGMAWLRRFNENNVDLNRNFLGPEEKYDGSLAAYRRVDPFLNPCSPPSKDFYHLKIAGLVLRHGFSQLKQAIASGQWEFPKGIFFGGSQLEQGPLRYAAFLTQRLSGAEQVVVIDVHTGLGKFGQDVLLVESEHYAKMLTVFGARAKPLEPERGPAYRVRGGHHSVFPRSLPGARVHYVAQEFGTYSAIKVLRALREENRWHHFGDATIQHPSKAKLKEAFCPEDDAWRHAVLARGKQLLRTAWALTIEQIATKTPEGTRGCLKSR